MKCEHFVELTTRYLEGVLDLPERVAVENHALKCAPCNQFLDETRHVVRALGELRHEPVSAATKDELVCLARQTNWGQTVDLGICGGHTALGSHIGHFWETEKDFRAGVALLETGLKTGDFCVVFGHDEANEKVLDILGKKGFDTQGLTGAGQLCTLGGKGSGNEMLASIGGRFQQAQAEGATCVRLLGNIGWGRPGWPGEDNILEFEANVTDAASLFPSVVVCMYDVRSLPGRVLLKGGFETHPLVIRGDAFRENPYYVPTQTFLAQMHGAIS